MDAFSVELILEIMSNCPPETLEAIAMVNRTFYLVYKSHEVWIMGRILSNHFGVHEIESDVIQDVRMHQNVDSGRMRFHLVDSSPYQIDPLPSGSSSQPLDYSKTHEKQLKIEFCWPESDNDVYLCSFYGNRVFWVDSSERAIYSSVVSFEQDMEFSDPQKIHRNDSQINLVLSNRDKLLAIFDEQTVKILDMAELRVKCEIRISGYFDMFTSMNFHGNHLLVAGSNGQILMFDTSGALCCRTFVPKTYMNEEGGVDSSVLMNLSLYGDRFLVAFNDGTLHEYQWDARLRVPLNENGAFNADLMNVTSVNQWTSLLDRQHSVAEALQHLSVASPSEPSIPETLASDLPVAQELSRISTETAPQQPTIHYQNNPLTLYFSSHFTITNAARPTGLLLHNRITGKVTELSEWNELAKRGIGIVPYRDLTFAEYSNGLVYAGVQSSRATDEERRNELLVWDLRGPSRRSGVTIERASLDDLVVWIGFSIL